MRLYKYLLAASIHCLATPPMYALPPDVADTATPSASQEVAPLIEHANTEAIVTLEHYTQIYNRLLDEADMADWGVYEPEQLDVDFSPLWTVKQLKLGKHWPNNLCIREPIGYVGDHFQRFQIRFSAIIQSADDPAVYNVQGKTCVKGHICDFKGTLTVKHIRLAPSPVRHSSTEHGHKEPLFRGVPVRHGMVVGQYELVEDATQLRAGTLTGVFASKFVCTPQGEVVYDISGLLPKGGRNNQFEGTWTSHKYKMVKACNWGDLRMPCSKGIDIGQAAFAPSPDFLSYGWQTYYNAYISKSVTKEEKRVALQREATWWEDTYEADPQYLGSN